MLIIAGPCEGCKLLKLERIRLKARIESLMDIIKHNDEVIKRQGKISYKKHNILCCIKEEIDKYFNQD